MSDANTLGKEGEHNQVIVVARIRESAATVRGCGVHTFQPLPPAVANGRETTATVPRICRESRTNESITHFVSQRHPQIPSHACPDLRSTAAPIARAGRSPLARGRKANRLAKQVRPMILISLPTLAYFVDLFSFQCMTTLLCTECILRSHHPATMPAR
ncbi:hypothetical protein BC628DRAFT_937167 [Trametes gibbosa]|nr:hypothetical protein BC628DRAFT_937167 [Trametes gibbosa]